MRMSYHGGMCCGIKHIYEMGYAPDHMVGTLAASDADDEDLGYDFTRQDFNVYPDALPIETALARLNRYLEWLTVMRPSGIVEITLTTAGCYDQSAWVPVLVEKGFKEVTPEGGVYNSNSANKVRVFHLYMANGDNEDDEDY